MTGRRMVTGWPLVAALVFGLLALGTAPVAAQTDVVCRMTDPRLVEISGMTASPTHARVLWMHNDSSGGPYIYAVDSSTCDVLATVTVDGLAARDIEGIASGVDGRGNPVLWIGDIGDNLGSWPDVRISRIDEPALRDATVSARTFSFSYGDGPVNAEALLALPSGPRLWVVSKATRDSAMWALPSPPVDGMTARRVAAAPALVTDGAFSSDGSRFVLRGYLDAVVYSGVPGRSEEVASIALPLQPQGEAVTWDPDGRALLIASERDDRLTRVELPPEAWADSARTTSPSPTASPSPSPTAAPDGDDSADRGLSSVVAVICGGLLIGIVIGLVVHRRQVRGGHRAREQDAGGTQQ